MRKIVFILAIVMMFVAVNSVQAATVVKKGNFTYSIKGDWQIQLRQKHGEDQDLDLEFDDLEIKNSVVYQLNDQLSAFGQLDFSFDRAGNSDRETSYFEEGYLGLKYQDWKILMGRTDTAADEFGIKGSLENYNGGDDVFDEYGQLKGDDLIMVIGKIANMVDIRAAYELYGDSISSTQYGSHYDAYAAVRFADFKVGGAFQHYEPFDSTTGMLAEGHAVDIWGVQASYNPKFIFIGIDYGDADAEAQDAGEGGTFLNFFVGVPVGGQVNLGAGYTLRDPDNVDAINGWYANVVYKFAAAKNVRLFAEIGDNDQENVDMGYLAGMRILF